MEFDVRVAEEKDLDYAQAVCDMIEEAAKARGTGIAKRQPEYISTKINQGKAVISLQGTTLAGFCYIETWGHDKYVANSGLIVSPDFRNCGLARRIKETAFDLSRKKYPDSKLFGITTSLAVMKINSDMGYKPVTFSELTDDEVFWSGCQSCPNYDILTRNDRKLCLCTGMLYKPEWEKKIPKPKEEIATPKPQSLDERWQQYKQHLRKRKSNPILTKIKERLFGKVEPL